jgi:ElaB/YqjD/DUF883 family membrane-anchored ribosome-binding protein
MMNTTQPNSGSGRDAMDLASDAASKVGHDAADALKSGARKASDVVEHAGHMAQERLDSMTAYVRRNPLQSTAIAAGVGFMFAMLARR